MKRFTFLTAILILCFALPKDLQSKVIEVCDVCTVNAIADAIEIAEDCDSLLIIGGTHKIENLAINKPLTLIGRDGPVLISNSGDEILTLIADDITIKGLTFKNVTTSYLKERSAIRVKRKKHFLIEDNTIIDCFFGVYLEKANYGVINNNTILGNATTEAESGNAIHAWYCNHILIYHNTLKGHRDGIYFEFVNESTINNNHSELNKRYGLHFMFSNDDIYTNNSFINNGVGVAVMFSRRIDMSHNVFSYNWGRAAYGLLLKEIYDAEIQHNKFLNNTIGIFVEGSNRIKYLYNAFEQNGWAIKFSGGCESNEIMHNNFLNNSLDLIVSTQLNDNLFASNYWSDYAGYDLDKDGTGDVPHYPVKLFSYVLNEVPEAIVLMRSFLVDIINYAEKVSPVFTPKEVLDENPAMKAYAIQSLSQ